MDTMPTMNRHDRIQLAAIAFTLALCAVIILTSCGTQNKLTEGKVIGKGYDDPDEWTTPGYWQAGTPGYTTCTGGYGNVPRSCSTTPGTPGYYVPPVDHYDGPHWYLKIEGIRGDGEKKAPVETHEVPQWQYDQLSQGDHWEKVA